MVHCSACGVEVSDWENHINSPVHVRNVERQRLEESGGFVADCPLCTIPFREPVLFENELVYLVTTKDLKGHCVRVMAVLKRHGVEPTFEERSFAYACVLDYMRSHTKRFFLAAPKAASVPDHWHLIACDDKFSDLDEKEALFTNPYIELPLRQKRVLIGLPAYNEADTVNEVIKVCKRFGEVVVVDDGSVDNTRHLVKARKVHLIRHKKNLGYGASIKDIFSYAYNNGFDVLVTLDADGQHNPEEIPVFLEQLESCDVVVGNRFARDCETPAYRRFGVKTLSCFSGLTDSQCGFRAYNKKAISAVCKDLHEKGMGASVEILKILRNKKLHVTEVPCTVKYENVKHSQNPVYHWLNVVSAMFLASLWSNPSRLLVPFGFLSLLVTVFTGIQTVNIYVQFHTVSLSWALVAVTGLICTLLVFNMLAVILVQKNSRMYEK